MSILPHRPLPAPDSNQDIEDGDPVAELLLRARSVARIVEHFACRADPWFTRSPRDFVAVEAAVTALVVWTERSSVLLHAEDVAA